MPKTFYSIIFTLIFLAFAQNIFAQKYLVFDKPGLVKRVRFHNGDQISFRLAGQKGFQQDVIVDIQSSNLILENAGAIHVDSITHFAMKNQNGFAKFRSVLSGVLVTAGIGYLIIDSFNNVIDNRDVFDKNTIAVAVPLVVTGLIIKPWAKRKHKIANNKRLFIIDMDSGLEQEN